MLRDDDTANPSLPRHDWPTPVAAAMCLGITASGFVTSLNVWVALAAAALPVAWVAHRQDRGRLWRCASLLCVLATAAAWALAQSQAMDHATLARHLTDDGSLADIEGVVTAGPHLVEGTAGPFAVFGYAPPGTLVEIDCDTLHLDGEPRPITGKVLARIDRVDAKLRPGQRLRCVGWLSALGPPKNPGDYDYPAAMRERGIVARLSMAVPENAVVLSQPAPPQRFWGAASWFTALRATLAKQADASLSLGMGDHPRTLGLLQLLLLGRTTQDIDTLREQFRDVGLSHILSISGAHLAILVGLLWVALRLVLPDPSRAAAVLLVVLCLYLLMVPLEVPVVRSAIMAGLYFGGVALGRRLGATTLLSLAAIVALLWRPADLLSAGAQLSFITVWALLRFTRPVSQALWPDPLITTAAPGTWDGRQWVMRRVADYTAVSVVAAVTTIPLVAWHFQMVNPLAVVLSILSLPIITALLAVGYVKVFAGMVLPSVSVLLGGPIQWLGDALAALVEFSARWPGSTLRLVYPLPLWWMLATMALGFLWLSGWFRGRTTAGVLAVALVAGYAAVWERPAAGAWLRGHDVAPEHHAALALSMIAVGDGSCYVLRSGGRVLVFDCGSQQYPLIGRRSVVPTLRTMGVGRVDVLIISHADLDHYNGSLDLLDALDVGRVWVSPEVIEDAAAKPRGATAFLVSELKRRSLVPEVVTRGHRATLGHAALEVLWPPPWHEGIPPGNAPGSRAGGGPGPGSGGGSGGGGNDWSVVLSVRVAGRRLLLSGDAQQAALSALLGDGTDLRADVAELPHHGSFVDASLPWIDRVRPSIVLQSSGPARLRSDRWETPLSQRPAIQRFITQRDGMVDVIIAADGTMTTRTFK